MNKYDIFTWIGGVLCIVALLTALYNSYLAIPIMVIGTYFCYKKAPQDYSKEEDYRDK
jgi:hypothetical protein